MARIAKTASVVSDLVGGKEPNAPSIKAEAADYQSKLLRAFHWYGMNCDIKDARKYLVEFGKKQHLDKRYIAGIQALDNDEVPKTIAWCARLLVHGATLSAGHAAAVEDRLTKLKATIDGKDVVAKAAASSKTAAAAPVKSVQDFMREKVQSMLGDFEGELDNYIYGKGKWTSDKEFYNYLRGKELPQAYIPFIVAWCDEKIKEFGTVLITKDVELKDGYGNFTKKQIGELVKWLAAIKNQAVDYGTFKKVNRAPRKRKAKPASVQVAKMKYKQSDDAFKVKSVAAPDIIGADQLWTFNTKTRVLAVYRATGSQGLGVKGTKIINFDTELSKQKRLRKPEQVLTKVAEGGKVSLRKLLDDVKAVEYTPNGRVNADTILLRVA